MQAMFALQILNQILALVPMGAALYTQFATQRGALEQMIAAGRNPTPEEWSSLQSQLQAASAQLQAVKP